MCIIKCKFNQLVHIGQLNTCEKYVTYNKWIHSILVKKSRFISCENIMISINMNSYCEKTEKRNK